MVSSFYRGKEFFSSAFFSRVGSKIKYSSKSSTYEKQKIEKIHVKENNHTYKTIFTWFGNLQGFHYYQGKYKVWLQCFNLSKDDHNNNKTLITKIGFFYIIRIGFIIGYKTGQKFSWGFQLGPVGPSLHFMD